MKMTHFNEQSFNIIAVRSPSWYCQVLGISRVKHDNGLRCFYIEGGYCLLTTRSYQTSPFVAEYARQFFGVNPMDCLRVILGSVNIKKISYNPL